MEHLERPDEITWDERRLWFEEREFELSRSGAIRPSEQACALMVELQSCFCAGAWVAVVILAATIVDTQASGGGRFPGVAFEDLRWLRGLRNRLLHEDRANPVLTFEGQWTERKAWERDARRAILLAMATLYGAAGEKK